MIHLLLHDDWEIYGDGTGDPQILMFETAKKLLDICDKYGAKYTFYAEIGQQLVMRDVPFNKWQKYTKIWEEILKDAIYRGHDVQLHFHPQWVGARLNNDCWELNLKNWHSGYVPYEVLYEWIKMGKMYLEDLLQPIKKDYKVLSYRAGGWLCQPSYNLYKALIKNDIICDVSVMKGRYYRFYDHSYIDFRNAVSRYEPWEVDPEDFAQAKKGSGLWELPVFTEETIIPHSVYLLKKAFRPLYYFRIYQKRKTQKGGGNYSPKANEKGNSKEHYGSFGYMHYKHLMSYVKQVREKSQSNKNIRHLIFMTHSKSFLDFENFERLLRNLSYEQEMTFSTTREFISNHPIFSKKYSVD